MSNDENGIKWISSTGGPLILIKTSCLQYWKGIFGISNESQGNSITDYERACEINDYVGLIDVGSCKALVLGEEPFETTWLSTEDGSGILVRWVWADNDKQVLAALKNLSLNQIWDATGIEITFSTESLILFDSSNSYDFLRNKLDIKIQPGTYTINSLFFKPDERVNLLIHRLIKRT